MNKTRLRRGDPERERYWREVVRGQGQSGQSVREYCRDAGVKESAFYWWRRELVRRSAARKTARSQPAGGRKPTGSSAGRGRRRSGASRRRQKTRRGSPGTQTPVRDGPLGADRSPFVPIHVLEGDAPASVEIHLGDGRMICVRPGFDRQTLRDVLAALEGEPC